MHRPLFAAITALVLALTPLSYGEESQAEVRVWEGYLWTNDGHFEIGTPVVAASVSAGSPTIIECKHSERLAPLVSALNDSAVFWNYTLEKPLAESKGKLPRVLVRFRGPVSQEKGERGYIPHDAPITMKPAKLLSVEFVGAAWLEHWAFLFRAPTSPWRLRDEPRGDSAAEARAAEARAFAPKAIATLKKMRAMPGPTDAQKKIVRQIDAETKVDTRFRERTELGILHWLHAVNDRYDLGIDGLDALGPVPPTGMELQRLFLASKTKAAFLERVRATWKGRLSALLLPNYVKNGLTTSWFETAVDDVEAWDDATYALRLATTRKMVKG